MRARQCGHIGVPKRSAGRVQDKREKRKRVTAVFGLRSIQSQHDIPRADSWMLAGGSINDNKKYMKRYERTGTVQWKHTTTTTMTTKCKNITEWMHCITQGYRNLINLHTYRVYLNTFCFIIACIFSRWEMLPLCMTIYMVGYFLFCKQCINRILTLIRAQCTSISTYRFVCTLETVKVKYKGIFFQYKYKYGWKISKRFDLPESNALLFVVGNSFGDFFTIRCCFFSLWNHCWHFPSYFSFDRVCVPCAVGQQRFFRKLTNFEEAISQKLLLNLNKYV